ncbi:hypothetical protein BDZ97DRAFT_1916854 [Flammula alnicola]|nr:hypothetical protein BDZ97DRAFT_1916854 [Flammula alnicola]
MASPHPRHTNDMARRSVVTRSLPAPSPFTRAGNTLAQARLRRSQGALLSLNLCPDLGLAFRDGEPPSAAQLMYGGGTFNIVPSIILPSASCIRSLTCIICTAEVIKSFLQIPLGSLNALESVEITFLNDFIHVLTPFTGEEKSNFTVFRSLPNLRSAAFHIFNNIDPLDLQLPWNNLTKLDLGSAAMPPYVFMTIIHRSAPSLTDGFFRIKFTHYFNVNGPFIRHAEARHLQTLRLRLIEPSNDHRMFSRLELPSIRELWMEVYDPNRGWEMSVFMSMLKKSAATLQVLMLSDPKPAPDALGPAPQRDMSHTELELLNKVPNLRALHLPSRLFIPEPTMEMIACGQLLPLLETLKVSSLNGSHSLSAVAKRNLLVKYNLLERGASSPTPHLRFPISYVLLMVPHEDKQVLEDQVAALQESGGLTGVELNIVCEDLERFAL